MFPPKYGSVEEVLEVKTASTRLVDLGEQEEPIEGIGFQRFASLDDNDANDGYLYLRVRAISSRVNKNNDGWPSDELKRAYTTFLGKPIFVDHNNDDPKRTRGVVIDARLHQEDEKTSALDPYYSNAPDNHKPPTWIELLLEVDGETYPKLAEAVRTGKVNSCSMGANIEKSVCSVCGNEADTPAQYCSHIKQKGATFEITADNGEKIKKKAYEDCYGVSFFEDSLVFDEADETALILEKTGSTIKPAARLEDFIKPVPQEPYKQYTPQSELVTAPTKVDTLRTEGLCPNCKSGELETDPDGVRRCRVCGYVPPPEGLDNPDLGEAEVLNDEQQAQDENRTDESGVTDIDPIEPVRLTRKAEPSNEGIGEMNFETTLRTSSLEEVESALPVKKASREIKLTNPEGVSFPVHLALRKAGLSATVAYPVAGTVNTSLVPYSPLRDHVLAKRAVIENDLTSMADLPITVEANEDVLDEIVALIQSGGKESAKVALPDKKQKAPVDKVVSDQKAPVESAVEEIEFNGNKYKLVPDETAERESVEFVVPDKEGAEKTADRRTIRREETENGDGTASRVEEIIEEIGDDAVASQEAPAPVAEEETPKAAEEEPEPAYASTRDPEERVLERLALAEFAVELGIVPTERKLAYVAELEHKSDEELASIRATLESVKEAGLSKQSRRRRADNGITSLPRLELSQPRVASTQNGLRDLAELPIESVFLPSE
jgi:hypothetical protein